MESAIISHSEDVDGLVAAAILLKNYPDSEVYLADYSNFIDKLKSIPEVDILLISDIGVNDSTFPNFMNELLRRRNNGTYISYFDHHKISPEQAKIVGDLVNYFHSDDQCASILVYGRGNNKTDFHTKVLAASAARADYCDTEPVAAKLAADLERLLLDFETSILGFTIESLQEEPEWRVTTVVEFLATGRYPHELHGVADIAVDEASSLLKLVGKIKTLGHKHDDFAVYRADEGDAAPAANFLKGIFNVPVGVAYEEPYGELTKFSFRAIKGTYDLSVIVKKISKELGVSGGGHPEAAGAGVPANLVGKFLERFQEELLKQKSVAPDITTNKLSQDLEAVLAMGPSGNDVHEKVYWFDKIGLQDTIEKVKTLEGVQPNALTLLRTNVESELKRFDTPELKIDTVAACTRVNLRWVLSEIDRHISGER